MTRPLYLKHVIVQRVRRRRDRGARKSRAVDGFMMAVPQVGQAIEIFSGNGESLLTTVTSRVRRILVISSGLVLFVETANSVYRIALDEPFVAEPLPARANVRVRFSPDGSEVTVFDDGEAGQQRMSGPYPESD